MLVVQSSNEKWIGTSNLPAEEAVIGTVQPVWISDYFNQKRVGVLSNRAINILLYTLSIRLRANMLENSRIEGSALRTQFYRES
jgi:hypothetical protein